MGCAFCKNPNPAEDRDRVDETSRLLDNEYSKSHTRQIRDDGTPNSVSSGNKTDEQSMLNRILHKTAQNIIDVSAIEPHSIERSEYMDRMRLYLEKTTNNEFIVNKNKGLPSLTHTPMTVLAADPISASDMKLITDASIALSNALSQIKVTCEQSMVETIGVESTTTAITDES